MIEIVINGRPHAVAPGLTLERLLASLDLPKGPVAVERNLSVVPRARFPFEPVEAGDRLEIVTLVGGG